MNLEDRVAKLERGYRRWRGASLALGSVLVLGVVMGQAGVGRVPELVRTRKLEVVDSQGAAVVTLDTTPRGGRVLMMNSDGHLLMEASAGSLDIYNSEGQKLVRLSATKNGEGLMATYNRRGEGVVAVGVTKDGEGALTTYNGAGQKLVSLSATDQGGAVSVWNSTGQAVSTIRADEQGQGEVGAWNRQGKGRTLTPGQ